MVRLGAPGVRCRSTTRAPTHKSVPVPRLKLVPEELTVTSFEPDAAHAAELEADALLAPTRQTRCETCRTLCLPYC